MKCYLPKTCLRKINSTHLYPQIHIKPVAVIFKDDTVMSDSPPNNEDDIGGVAEKEESGDNEDGD